MLLILGLAVALAASGCGSGGGGGSSSPSAPASSASTGSPVPVTKIDMHNIQFNPKTITVKKGTTVEWVNQDSVAHDVTKVSGPGQQFSSGTGNLRNGDTYKQTFNTAGTIHYQCTVHAGMTGTIVVK